MTAQRQGTSLLALLGFGALALGAGAVGAVATRKRVKGPWYALLKKPRFQPPRQAFAPVWTALYALMSVSAFRVWRAEPSEARTRALGLWGTQLALNAAWSPIFFGAKSPRAALVDLTMLLPSIGAYAFEARKVDRAAAWLMAPYVAWTAFAGVLNEEIVRENA